VRDSSRQLLVKAVFIALMTLLVVLGLQWRSDRVGRADGGHLDNPPGDAGQGRPESITTGNVRRNPPADLNFNPGWIGSACRSDSDCEYPGGFCLLDEEGFPRGTCSARCHKYCPDRHGQLFSPTFCIEDPTWADGQGICLARCNLHITVSGCRPGYVCTSMQRLGQTTTRMVCLPDNGTPFPPTECTRRLDALPVTYARPQMADDPTHAAREGGPAPAQPICQIDTPVLLATPIHHVDFRHQAERLPGNLLVACRLALALEKLGRLLEPLNIVEVEHNGTYVCRTVAGSAGLSAHGRGLAIDITAFQRTLGTSVPVSSMWRSPDGAQGRFIRGVLDRIAASGIFTVVLSPKNSSSHRDHLHLEVK